MKVAAIISEFNPFHNGHKLLVDYCKEVLQADYVLSIMSGDYVQRGLPAFVDKEIRTEMALLSGIDGVLLLPTVYSTMSAELFAYASVHILNRLNTVDYLVFGSESGNIDEIKACAEALFHDGRINSPKIQQLLKEGNTFARARSILFPEFSELLSEPNNTLGIEYCLSLLELNSKMTPVTIKRTDSGYNSDIAGSDSFASAKAVRTLINNRDEKFIQYIPETISTLYKETAPLTFDDFSSMLYYSLLSNKDNLSEFADISEDFSAKIRKNLSAYTTASRFADLLKSKDLTHSGITRALLHILLGIKKTPSYYKEVLDRLTHVRLLGMNTKATELFSKIKKNSTITLAVKVPDCEGSFNEVTKDLFEKDLFAFTLYDRVKSNKYNCDFRPEYSKMFIKLK